MQSRILSCRFNGNPVTKTGTLDPRYLNEALELFELGQSGVFNARDHLGDDDDDDIRSMSMQFSGGFSHRPGRDS